MLQEVCQDNTANLVSTLIAAGLLILSEIMPFIKSESNGILQAIVLRLKSKFPVPTSQPNTI